MAQEVSYVRKHGCRLLIMFPAGLQTACDSEPGFPHSMCQLHRLQTHWRLTHIPLLCFTLPSCPSDCRNKVYMDDFMLIDTVWFLVSKIYLHLYASLSVYSVSQLYARWTLLPGRWWRHLLSHGLQLRRASQTIVWHGNTSSCQHMLNLQLINDSTLAIRLHAWC